MRRSIYAVAAVAMAALLAGCGTTPRTEQGREDLRSGAERAMDRLTSKDPGLREFVNNGHGHVIFPKVGKGGLIVGGGYGRGIVYEQGAMIGYADITQATIGAQIGGQTFSELIVFENPNALDRFRQNKLEFAANASAVAIQAGAAASAKYENGVAVFVEPRAGLMAEAAIGGQKFTFVPARGVNANAGSHATTRPAMR